ncbi:heavy metal translocatin [Patellaria atrata CBS 101060]|uniref:Heavy metal translocatin n=1 Tax=Patellaria atrata CBS 101060 TaxID=1346257 RepID=A0A9P4S5V7_9PEZI|nr:heavy metal translocatin [Patellaria atrata CBS 101060]
MASSLKSAKARSTWASRLVLTTLFISNLHCPSCVRSIENAFLELVPKPLSISVSILSHRIDVRHDIDLTTATLINTLELTGFEVHSTFQTTAENTEQIEVKKSDDPIWKESLHKAVSRWENAPKPELNVATEKMEKHLEQCEQCRVEVGSKDQSDVPSKTTTKITSDHSDMGIEKIPQFPFGKEFIVVEQVPQTELFKASLTITGMTCSSCVASITMILDAYPWIDSVNVNLLTNSASVSFQGKDHINTIIESIENAGFDAAVEHLEELNPSKAHPPQLGHDRWLATYAIGGMTCAACVGNITQALQQHGWIESVDVNLISNSASIVFQGKDHLSTIKETIEDVGYDATLDNIINAAVEVKDDVARSVSIRVDGMFCSHCPNRILQALKETYGPRLDIETIEASRTTNFKMSYLPQAPDFTIRHILASIAALNPDFDPYVYHPQSLEDRAREMHLRERRRILLRLALSVTVAIPTFLIGVVFMALFPMGNFSRHYLMQPMWAGSVSRGQWALFILATPIYFFAADVFHRRALKEVYSMWRPGSRTPVLRRFIRFGSMNMLMSLGTSIAYFASVAELSLGASGAVIIHDGDFYFDAVVFLTMFLLTGRFLEAYSKAKTGDAVASLGKLRPEHATLVDPSAGGDQKIAVDLLDVGDIVRIPQGTSPPFDGVVVEGDTNFDESSLTGESRLISKTVGDEVFSGTVNRLGPISIKLTRTSGKSMLDQIINAVREGQTKRAPVERVADIITGSFVPIVVLIAVTTWIVWLTLGTTGALPKDYRGDDKINWALWSVRFAISVFVIACPCGIGLAAPTALFVGGGLAAHHGILVKGGGEAFQEASGLDCIVFDKTGTLTQGGDPAVLDFEKLSEVDEKTLLGMTKKMEESSSHPIAGAIASYCSARSPVSMEPTFIDEIPGKGLKGEFRTESGVTEVIIGNETLMADFHVAVDQPTGELLDIWKRQGKSVALLAIAPPVASDADVTEASSTTWMLAAAFSISDAIREEARPTVAALQSRGIAVWMLSGDNHITATAVGAEIGIDASNIIAGVLPDQKAEKIQFLQKSLPKRRGRKGRAIVAMVGDGINDSPALAMADVGIAIGSGSDVALSSASFVLISSNLTSLLVLIDLSRKVFRRVWFNFGWALVYNVVAMPIAAGVLYPVKTPGGGRIKLAPAWAALAMALSSVSVVCSSLLLRSKVPGVGFRVSKEVQTVQVVGGR